MALDVQFWYTTEEKLPGLAVQDGRIIALSDGTGYFYDMGGVRHRVNSIECVSELPNLAELAQLKKAVDDGNQTDNLGLLDLLYVTEWGIFKYNGASTEAEAGWQTILPADVHEAPDDGYVYSRQRNDGHRGTWVKLRWIFASDDEIPVASLNTRIASILGLADTPSSSIKIAGKVNLSSDLAVNVGTASKTMYLDLEDAEFKGNSKLSITCVDGSQVRLHGTVGCKVSISGAGQVAICDGKLSFDVSATGFCGTLAITHCMAESRTIEYSHNGSENIGAFIINAGYFKNCEIETPAEAKCKSMIQGNIFVDTTVTRNRFTLDTFYNNEGWTTQQ